MRDRPKVFISYVHQDRDVARSISEALLEAGLESSLALHEVTPDDSILSLIRTELNSSDYLIVLISPASLDSSWIKTEMQEAITDEWAYRRITVLPVKVRPTRMPPYLARIKWLDLSRHYEEGLESLAEQLKVAIRIDLDKLSPRDFTKLVADLMRASGFKKVREQVLHEDLGYDLIGILPRKDPFGRVEEETWIVEVKTHKLRTDLSALRKFVANVGIFGETVRGLFVTSGRLSSNAREWLNQQRTPYGSRVSVLEGIDITRLLIKKRRVAIRHFSG